MKVHEHKVEGTTERLMLHKVHNHAVVLRLSPPYFTLNLHNSPCERRRRYTAVGPAPEKKNEMMVVCMGRRMQ